MGYIGPSPNPGQNREVDDISSGFNGSEVNFTLQVTSQNVSPGSANAIIVSLGGVVQNPGTDYTVAASTLTFTTAPASGLSFFGLVLGQSIDTEGTADGSITLDKFINGTSSNNGKFLRANNGAIPSFETVTGTTINNNANNRIITGSASANTLEGESAITFDGTKILEIQSSAGGFFQGTDTDGGTALLEMGNGNVAIQADTGNAISDSKIQFLVDNSEKMTLTHTGLLGIGRTDPSAAVHIRTSNDVSYNISTAVNNPGLIISSNGTSGTDKCIGLNFSGPNSNGEGFITMVGTSSSEMEMRFALRSGGSRSDRVIFQPNGRVRMPEVYSTAGSSMRDVQIESDGTLCGLSSITAAKTNIADVTDISWLYNLKPKTFNFRKKTSDIVTGANTYLSEAETEKAYGLLAEDVETVNKDFCFYDKDSEGNDVLAGVYYKTMVVPLLKAVQDLKTENTALTARVAALEAA